MFVVRFFFCNEDAETSFLLHMFQDDRPLKNFSEFCYSSELTLSAKTVAFVEITRQTFDHTQLHFFSQKPRNLIFSCDCFDQRKKTFFAKRQNQRKKTNFQLKTENIAAPR